MNRRESLLASIGLLLFALSAVFLFRARLHERTNMFQQACGMPVGILTPEVRGDAPSAVVFHGLGANAVVMRSLGQYLGEMGFRVYLLDLPGHGNNTDHFSFQRSEECAARLISQLERDGEIRLDNTVLVGHSMGGALAIRMADYFPTAATVAISPAPMIHAAGMPSGAILIEAPRRMPVNLLVLMGQFDFPYSRASAAELIQMGGGQRSQPEDFLQKRAIKLVTVPGATHTSLIFNVPRDSPIASWLNASVPTAAARRAVNSIRPELWSTFGLLGLLLMFPLAASSVARVFRLSSSPTDAAGISALRAILSWIAAGLIAVTTLKLIPQLSFLPLMFGGYLAFLLLVAGILLLVFLWRPLARMKTSSSTPANWRGVFLGVLLGVAAMIVFGAWVTLQLSDTWLNAPRWLCFFPAVLACLPYALAEEWVLGASGAGNRLANVRRYLLFGVLRLLLWLSILFALYVYSSGQILLSVLVFYMGIFSLLVRFGADAVRRRTNSVASAAVFTAILMAWFIASVFPII